MVKWGWVGFLVICMAGPCAQAAPPTAGTVIPLYAGTAPGSEQATQVEVRDRGMDEARVRNVTRPDLTAYLPRPENATGAAVIIAPGGGFLMLSIESEGEQVARWLADRGVAAFVLKYRLNPTPPDTAAFQAQLLKLIQSARDRDVTKSIDQSEGAQQGMADGLQAVKLVRKRAGDFGVDPDRIGFVGFSAGGIVAMNVATAYDADSRPNFVGCVYGALPTGRKVPDDAPPLFLAVAADDPLLAGASAPIFDAWQEKHRPAELHIFQKGGHGFGMKHTGNSSDHWIDEYFWWMQSQGILTTAKH